MVEEVPMNDGASDMVEKSRVEIHKEDSSTEVKPKQLKAGDDGERTLRPAERLRPWRVRCVLCLDIGMKRWIFDMTNKYIVIIISCMICVSDPG